MSEERRDLIWRVWGDVAIFGIEVIAMSQGILAETHWATGIFGFLSVTALVATVFDLRDIRQIDLIEKLDP